VVWVRRDRDGATLTRFFAWMGQCRARAIRMVCRNMWRPSLAALRTHVAHATIVFDCFHPSQHFTRAVDGVRRHTGRQMAGREKAEFERTRFFPRSACGSRRSGA